MKRILILIACICAAVSCGMDYHAEKVFCVYICPECAECEFFYDDVVYLKDSEQAEPVRVAKDTVLCCPVAFSFPSSAGKDDRLGETRYAALRRLSGAGSCELYLLNADKVEYNGEKYNVMNLLHEVIDNNDTSLITYGELKTLIRQNSSKFSLAPGDDSIIVPIKFL
ncbi:MAG: hypothetical protein NC335_05220 [Bacteroides sp.]|nr:hypothetical protein [Bacteroides sp.]